MSTTERPKKIYVTSKEAAGILGIGEHVVREHLSRKDRPLPHLQIGNVKYVRVSVLEDYFSGFEIGTLPRKPA